MNETIFFIHIFLTLVFSLGALKLGKEALMTWVAIQALLANLFVIKQMMLCGREVTCSDVFAIGSIFGLNLLQEYFGKKEAQRAIWICFYLMIFFALASQIHLLYVPSAHDVSHASFSVILSPAPRLLLASLATFFIVQSIDIKIFQVLVPKLKHFALRNALSLILSQLIDTVLFSILGLYGLVESIMDIMLVSFVLKLIIAASITPFVALSKKITPLRAP